MDLKQKIVGAVIGCVLVIGACVGVIVSLSVNRQADAQVADAEKALLREKELSLKSMLDGAVSMIEEGFGDVDDAEHRRLAIDALSGVRYADGAGYLFAYEEVEDGSFIYGFHGTKPNLNGTVAKLDGGDAKGFAFREALVKAARSGGGMVSYYYENPKTKAIMRKMAYARCYEPWDWVIVTGIYIDDVQESVDLMSDRIHAQTRALLVRLGSIVGVVLLVSAICLYLIIHFSINPLYSIISRLRLGAEGINGASSQVAEISQSLAEGATEQAAGIQETTSSLQEIASRIASITEGMRKADEFMGQVQDSVRSGAATSNAARGRWIRLRGLRMKPLKL